MVTGTQKVLGNAGITINPMQACTQERILVGRIPETPGQAGGLNLWITSDNGKYGAALGAVQIAELLKKCYMWAVVSCNN